MTEGYHFVTRIPAIEKFQIRLEQEQILEQALRHNNIYRVFFVPTRYFCSKKLEQDLGKPHF